MYREKELTSLIEKVVNVVLLYTNLDDHKVHLRVFNNFHRIRIQRELINKVLKIINSEKDGAPVVKIPRFLDHINSINHPSKPAVLDLITFVFTSLIKTDRDFERVKENCEEIAIEAISWITNESLWIGAVHLKKNFSLRGVTTFTVPDDYDHNIQIKRSRTQVGKFRLCCGGEGFLTDENLHHLSSPLIPGSTYLVKIFSVGAQVTLEEVKNLLRGNRAKKVGAQGLSLYYQFHPEIFRLEEFMMSFDLKELSENDEDNWMIALYQEESELPMEFWKMGYEIGLCRGFSLLCICDPPLGENI